MMLYTASGAAAAAGTATDPIIRSHPHCSLMRILIMAQGSAMRCANPIGPCAPAAVSLSLSLSLSRSLSLSLSLSLCTRYADGNVRRERVVVRWSCSRVMRVREKRRAGPIERGIANCSFWGEWGSGNGLPDVLSGRFEDCRVCKRYIG